MSPGPGSLVQMGNANLNPWTEAKVNTKNPDRGPLLILDGEKDAQTALDFVKRFVPANPS
jgi:hypothetical protein